VKLTTHFCLVPSLKMHGTVPLLFECLCGITPVQMNCELWCDRHITQHIYNVCNIIIIIISLSWSWATCWPVTVSRIQKSL